MLANNKSGNLHLFEQFDCPFALKNMLRFVVHTGFPTPANNKETRNPVYLLMEQRSDRVDDISKSAVLQINDRDFSGCQMVPGG